MIPRAWDLEDTAGVILFDGDCAFCRNVVGLLLRRLPEVKLRVCSTRSPVGSATARALGGDPADTFAFVTSTEVHLGADAYLRILALEPGSLSWLGRAIAALPAAVRNGAYDWVANHRPLMSKLMGRGSGNAIPLDRFVPGGV
jgi:predicted DCC family thiol-disulfide oxidoreductase YuxK